MRFKNLKLDSPLMLSPMSGFTNLPFRVAIRALGGLSVATTDFVNARSLIELNPKAIQLVSASAWDRPLGVQLFGGNKEELSYAAKFLEDLGIDFIDINLGCPSHKVTRGGAGAALMQDEELTEELLYTIVKSVDIPVTAKMRLGWDSINAHVIAPRLEEMGVAAVAIHGRTKEQGYTGKVNLDGIRMVVDSVKSIPVIGNGDVYSHLDAQKMIEEIGCAGVMVGRAALQNPFFFRDTHRFLKTGEEPDKISLSQRLAFMHFHFSLAMQFWGEEHACVVFRKVVPGYSEYLPMKNQWSTGVQHLSTSEDYRELVKKLTPEGLPEWAYFSEAEQDVYRRVLEQVSNGH
ncbi:MAG: tRNA dihydrouridine synthase DusB [Verrucomicrobiota bacterium]